MKSVSFILFLFLSISLSAQTAYDKQQNARIDYVEKDAMQKLSTRLYVVEFNLNQRRQQIIELKLDSAIKNERIAKLESIVSQLRTDTLSGSQFTRGKNGIVLKDYDLIISASKSSGTSADYLAQIAVLKNELNECLKEIEALKTRILKLKIVSE